MQAIFGEYFRNGAMAMSIIFSLYLILFIAHFIIRSWWKQNRYKSLPPGPTPIPVLGTPKYMDLRYAKRNFTKLSQKYGSVFTIWKKSEPVIVLCGYDTVKDGLMDHAEYFCERPYIPVVYDFSKGYDVNGPRWRSLRRFTVDFLRKYGMGKKVMEMRILEESKYLVQAVAESGGKIFNPTMALSCAVGNTMGGMMFGLHFDYKDKQLHDLLFSITKHIRGFVSPLSTVCNSLPILLKIPYIRQKVFQNTEYILRFVAESVKHHKDNLNPESPKDFIDYFLLKIKEVENEVDPDFCDTSLPAMVLTTLAAGTETTAASLKFIVVLLAHYPEVQAKVQQEIDEATKNLRQPEIADRPQMPYTYAVIHEIQRVLDIAPTALFHAVNQEVKFRGYTIPKGTTVIPFLTSVLMDPSQWETPEEFNPRHFLTEDGQFRNQLAFMVYSAGKRVCPAENMARMELFLFISALLQKFTFILPPGTKRQDAKFLNLHKTEILLYAEICAEPRLLSK